MKLSTGKVAFPLQFDNGDVENIMINPHDAKLRDRIKAFEPSLHARLENFNFEKYKSAFADGIDVSNLNFSKLTEMSDEELEKITRQTEAISELEKELEKELCAELDIVFDCDISSKAFKYVPPLAVVENENGECEMYILQVFKALAIEIQKYGDKISTTTNKYIEKYPKRAKK